MQRDGTSFIPSNAQIQWIATALCLITLVLNVLYSFWAVSGHADMQTELDQMREDLATAEVRLQILETARSAEELMNDE